MINNRFGKDVELTKGRHKSLNLSTYLNLY